MRSIDKNWRIAALCVLAVLGSVWGAEAATTVTVSELEKSGVSDGSVQVTLKKGSPADPEPSSLLFDLKYAGNSLIVTPPSSVQVPSAVVSGTNAALGDDFSVDAASIGTANSGTLRVVISSKKKDAVLKDGTTFRVPVRMKTPGASIASGFPVSIGTLSSDGSRVGVGPSARVSGITSGGTIDASTNPPTLNVDTLASPGVRVSSVSYRSAGVELAAGAGASLSRPWSPAGSGPWSVYGVVTFSDGSVVQTNPVALTVTGVRNRVGSAIYTGAVLDEGTLQAAQKTGSVVVTTTTAGPYGSYSLKLILEGQTYAAAGRFDAMSVATPSFPAKVGGVSKTLNMRLEQGLIDYADSISGLVTDGTIRSSGAVSGGSLLSRFVADRVVWEQGKRESTQMAGRYTATLADVGTNPKPYGTGALNVSGLGVVTGQLTMYDSTRVTSSGYLSKNGVWQPYASLSNGAGFLVGQLDFSDQNNAGWLGGALKWRRDASKLVRLGVDGGTFAAAGAKTAFPLKAGQPNILVRISGGGLAAPIEQAATYSNKTISFPTTTGSNPYKIKAEIDASSGAFTGSFLPGGDTLTIGYGGVVLQRQLRADATFVRSGTMGAVRITPLP